MINEKHKGQCYFYLLIDFNNKCNIGYAFINFTHYIYGLQLYSEFHKKDWSHFNSEKICCITYARIQGKIALIDHFQSSKVLCYQDHSVKPLIFPTCYPNETAIKEIRANFHQRLSYKFCTIAEKEEDKSSSGDSQ